MNSDSLQTSFWLMIFLQTIGSVDMPGRGARKMPAPFHYAAIFVTWLVLQLVSGISEGAARAAAGLGWLLVLAGMVLGPFGKQAVQFMNNVAKNFPSAGASNTSTPTSTTPTTSGSVLV